MTLFKDIPIGETFFDPDCGEDFVKLNALEARMVFNPFPLHGEDPLAPEPSPFNDDDIVMTLEEADADADD